MRDALTGGSGVATNEPSALAERTAHLVLARRLEPLLGAGLRRVGVTSSVPGEGRSASALGLAAALSVGGRSRVVLVDGDPRAASIERRLGLQKGPGLRDVVEGKVALDAALRLDPATALTVLGAREEPAPDALLAAPGTGRLLSSLAEAFDVVVVDAPPVLPHADLLALLPSLDVLLLVVRAGRTPREVIARAVRVLGAARVLGVVLLGVGPAVAPAPVPPPKRRFQWRWPSGRAGEPAVIPPARPEASLVAGANKG